MSASFTLRASRSHGICCVMSGLAVVNHSFDLHALHLPQSQLVNNSGSRIFIKNVDTSDMKILNPNVDILYPPGEMFEHDTGSD